MMKATATRSTDHMFNKLSPLEAVQRSVEVLFSNLCTFVLIGLLFVPLWLLIGAYAVAMMPRDVDATYGSSPNEFQTTAPEDDQVSSSFGLIFVLLGFLIFPVACLSIAATIRATAEVYAGERPQVGALLKAGSNHICRLFCFGFVLLVPVVGLVLLAFVMALTVISLGGVGGSDDRISTFAIVLALILFPLWFAVYFYVMIPFQIAQPSLVLEPTTVTGVVSRVWALSSGQRCSIFLSMFILGLVNFTAGLIPIVNVFWHVIALPLTSILATVLFLNLRVEKEGLNLSGLRGELGMDLLDETELTPEKYVDVPSKDMDGKHEMV